MPEQSIPRERQNPPIYAARLPAGSPNPLPQLSIHAIRRNDHDLFVKRSTVRIRKRFFWTHPDCGDLQVPSLK